MKGHVRPFPIARSGKPSKFTPVVTSLTHQEALMFPKYRHTPIFDSERKLCAVCHQAVYSLAGIHPQCAVKQADALESKSKREGASKGDSTVAVEAPGTLTVLEAPSVSI
jgi:hypothetical protein